MTVIAWDGTTLAADRQLTWGDARMRTTKIRRMPDGSLIATAGTFSLAQAMVEHLTSPSGQVTPPWPKVTDEEGATVIIVSPQGQATWYMHDRPIGIPIEQAQVAFGSGREFAMGAMAAGADARRAVEICIELSPGCGFGVQAEVPGVAPAPNPAES